MSDSENAWNSDICYVPNVLSSFIFQILRVFQIFNIWHLLGQKWQTVQLEICNITIERKVK